MKEKDILSYIYKFFDYKDKKIIIGVGDDCAVVNYDQQDYLVITTDDMVDNTHFIADFLKPNEVASRLVRINVSDIYSMGDSKPLYCLVTAGLNDEIGDQWIKNFLQALKKELDLFNIKNIGGNLVKSQTLFFTMTLIGKVKKNRIVKRKGAEKGDFICILGKTGFSYVAVEIMKNKKRIDITKSDEKLIDLFSKPPLFDNFRKKLSLFATSMIDNSDGLYKSVQIIAESNSLKAVIDKNLVVKTSSSYVKEKLKNVDYIFKASISSDDYNPVFTVRPRNFEILKKSLPYLFKIGHLEEGRGVEILNYEEKNIETFEHF
ncbi:MAG: thiamine-phosphate kinase [Elusimicrobiales bacterium]|nr:thiamine-phosphate kinase [Elusimicrobiales bacterium]